MGWLMVRAGGLLALVAAGPCLADPLPVIHYAPVENLERVDVSLIDHAKSAIDIAAYVLTDRPVMLALLRAAQRGVKVRVYMDGRRIGEREPKPLFLELLSSPGIEIRFKRRGSPLMHLKSYQIDGLRLRTGAANFSASALKRQDNDLIIIESQAAALAFKQRFEAIFDAGEPEPAQQPAVPGRLGLWSSPRQSLSRGRWQAELAKERGNEQGSRSARFPCFTAVSRPCHAGLRRRFATKY
jgi:phosphatidylserine/phosphatidylglycerophosphate/cardiolipin synthase-like enzyme